MAYREPLFRYRLGGRADFPACLDLLWPGDPTAAMGRTLASLWDRCLDQRTFVMAEMTTGDGRVQPCGFWLSVFVARAFAERLQRDPQPHPARAFFDAMKAGRSPLLTERDIARAHANGGVDLLVLHCGSRFVDFADPRTIDVLTVLGAGFYFTHSGYTLRSIALEAYGAPAAAHWVAGQFRRRRDFAAWDPKRFAHVDADHRPCLFGLTRDDVSPGAMNPLAGLFFTSAPRLGLASAEQRTLMLALSGASDEAIAEALDVSTSTVKKTWRRVFDRAGQSLPHVRNESDPGVRGKERRCLVLEYVRQHPEELRPYVRPRPADGRSR